MNFLQKYHYLIFVTHSNQASAVNFYIHIFIIVLNRKGKIVRPLIRNSFITKISML